MHRQTAQHGKLGLILLITAATVAAVLLIPNIAHGLGAVTIRTQKSGSPSSFHVGEKVIFDSTINIGTDTVGTSTTLAISGSGGSPGPESVNVSIPIKEGAQDLTSLLPVDGVTGESGSLTVTSTLTELGGRARWLRKRVYRKRLHGKDRYGDHLDAADRGRRWWEHDGWRL